MKDCEPVRARLSEWLDGELSATEKIQVEAHLASCRACAQEAAELRAIAKEVRNLPRHAAPAGLLFRVRAGMAAPATRRKARSLFATAWLSAAALMAVAILVFAITRRPFSGSDRTAAASAEAKKAAFAKDEKAATAQVPQSSSAASGVAEADSPSLKRKTVDTQRASAVVREDAGGAARGPEDSAQRASAAARGGTGAGARDEANEVRRSFKEEVIKLDSPPAPPPLARLRSPAPAPAPAAPSGKLFEALPAAPPLKAELETKKTQALDDAPGIAQAPKADLGVDAPPAAEAKQEKPAKDLGFAKSMAPARQVAPTVAPGATEVAPPAPPAEPPATQAKVHRLQVTQEQLEALLLRLTELAERCEGKMEDLASAPETSQVPGKDAGPRSATIAEPRLEAGRIGATAAPGRILGLAPSVRRLTLRAPAARQAELGRALAAMEAADRERFAGKSAKAGVAEPAVKEAEGAGAPRTVVVEIQVLEP